MPNKNQTEWDSKKIQILKVSQQIFARYGYFKTTMEDIAHAMGMKKGSLYYYYKGKEDILKDVVHYESEQFLTALQQELQTLQTPQEKVRRFLQFRLKEFMNRMNLHQISIQAFLEAASIITEVYHQCFEREVALLATVIQEGIDQGVFVQCDARRIANSLLTYAEAVKFREFHRNKNIFASELDYSAIEDDVLFTTDMIINGITRKKSMK